MFEKALEIRMEAYGGSHPCIAEIKNNIAMLHFSQVGTRPYLIFKLENFKISILTIDICVCYSGKLHGGSAPNGGCAVHM